MFLRSTKLVTSENGSSLISVHTLRSVSPCSRVTNCLASHVLEAHLCLCRNCDVPGKGVCSGYCCSCRWLGNACLSTAAGCHSASAGQVRDHDRAHKASAQAAQSHNRHRQTAWHHQDFEDCNPLHLNAATCRAVCPHCCTESLFKTKTFPWQVQYKLRCTWQGLSMPGVQAYVSPAF